jgi:hypothetical protein
MEPGSGLTAALIERGVDGVDVSPSIMSGGDVCGTSSSIDADEAGWESAQ